MKSICELIRRWRRMLGFPLILVPHVLVHALQLETWLAGSDATSEDLGTGFAAGTLVSKCNRLISALCIQAERRLRQSTRVRGAFSVHYHKWYAGLAIFSELAVARLGGITAA